MLENFLNQIVFYLDLFTLQEACVQHNVSLVQVFESLYFFYNLEPSKK